MGEVHPIWLVVAGVGISLFPVLVGGLTSYLKVNIVVGMIKSALGVQQVPGMVAEMVLALAVTSFVMGPTFLEIGKKIEGISSVELSKVPTLGGLAACSNALEPWKAFLTRHAGAHELQELLELQKKATNQEIKNPSELPLSVLLPAFVLTELKESFSMGFCLLLPFLVVDLIVANILAGLGMQMVSPTLISLPLKVILFVLADGWVLLTKALILSYQGGSV